VGSRWDFVLKDFALYIVQYQAAWDVADHHLKISSGDVAKKVAAIGTALWKVIGYKNVVRIPRWTPQQDEQLDEQRIRPRKPNNLLPRFFKDTLLPWSLRPCATVFGRCDTKYRIVGGIYFTTSVCWAFPMCDLVEIIDVVKLLGVHNQRWGAEFHSSKFPSMWVGER